MCILSMDLRIGLQGKCWRLGWMHSMRLSGVHKGRFSKGGLVIYVLLLCYYC